MTAENRLLLGALGSMMSDKVANYALPGLNSYLLGKGRVRLFEATRFIDEKITPHNHRFELTCLVLRGVVWNTTWMTWDAEHRGADRYQLSRVYPVNGGMGMYRVERQRVVFASTVTKPYTEGSVYQLNANEFHSIKFSRDAMVLVFEGPTQRDWSEVLEPIVDGQVIPTLQVPDWMFKKG